VSWQFWHVILDVYGILSKAWSPTSSDDWRHVRSAFSVSVSNSPTRICRTLLLATLAVSVQGAQRRSKTSPTHRTHASSVFDFVVRRVDGLNDPLGWRYIVDAFQKCGVTAGDTVDVARGSGRQDKRYFVPDLLGWTHLALLWFAEELSVPGTLISYANQSPLVLRGLLVPHADT